MTDRDRLIELVEKGKYEYANDITDHTETDYIVECLLDNGVIVPPVKIGQTVYELRCNDPFSEDISIDIVPSTVKDFAIFTTEDIHGMAGVGKTVFLTKEEAEEKLKEINK